MTGMATSHRSTIYFESNVLRALKLKSATTDTPVSSIVNDALRKVFAQEVNDHAIDARPLVMHNVRDFETLPGRDCAGV